MQAYIIEVIHTLFLSLEFVLATDNLKQTADIEQRQPLNYTEFVTLFFRHPISRFYHAASIFGFATSRIPCTIGMLQLELMSKFDEDLLQRAETF